LLDDRATALAMGWLGEDRVNADTIARIAWSVIVEPGDGTAGTLIQSEGAFAALERVAHGAENDRALSQALARWAPRWHASLVHGAIEQAARRGIRLIVPTDDAWPRGFDDLGEHAPVCLWVRGGDAAFTGSHAVSLVGARSATPYGED